MEQESTAALMEVLKAARPGDVPGYQAKHLSQTFSNFAAYMDGLIEEKGLKRQDIFQKADLPQKYGYKLLSGESHTTDRDKLLRLFLAMGLTLVQTQRALALYGLPALYPRRRRDAILIIALNRGISSVDAVNDWLKEQGEAPLSACNG